MLDEQIELCNASLHKGVPEKDAYAIKAERASLMAYREKLECLPSAHPDLDEWCTDCKEYDSDKHCCPRFSRVIREALKEAQPETAKRIVGKSRDGMTLWYQCDMCNEPVDAQDNYCRGCGRRLIDE